MKKHGLTKVLAVLLLLVIVATYIIEGRQGISHLGVGDAVLNYFQSFYYFFDTVLFVLAVGAFYGLLEHVPAYTKLQENIVTKANGSRKAIFIIIAIFALLSSLTGFNVALLIFIPFAISLVLKMGFDKIVALFSTVGAVTTGLIGGIFTTFRDPSNYYATSFTNFDKFVGLDSAWETLIPKIALLVIATALLMFFVNKYINKKQPNKVEVKQVAEGKKTPEVKKEKVEKKEVKQKEVKEDTKKEVKSSTAKKTTNNKKGKTETKSTPKKKTSTKKNLSAAKQEDTIVIKKDKKVRVWPLIVVIAILFILLVLGYLPWNPLFEITIFNDFHKWLTELSIGDFKVFTSIISSTFTAFGTWATLGNYMMIMVLLAVFSIIIKFVYKIKFNDMLDYCAEGVKKMVPSALTVMLAYTILVCAYNNGFMETVITGATDKFADNIMIHSLISILGSVINVDLYYTAIGIFSPIVTGLSESANLQVFAIAFQSFYGLVQLVGPTSLLLIVCLTYTEVSYKNWLKNIWRLVLGLFILIFAVMLIVSLI